MEWTLCLQCAVGRDDREDLRMSCSTGAMVQLLCYNAGMYCMYLLELCFSC